MTTGKLIKVFLLCFGLFTISIGGQINSDPAPGRSPGPPGMNTIEDDHGNDNDGNPTLLLTKDDNFPDTEIDVSEDFPDVDVLKSDNNENNENTSEIQNENTNLGERRMENTPNYHNEEIQLSSNFDISARNTTNNTKDKSDIPSQSNNSNSNISNDSDSSDFSSNEKILNSNSNNNSNSESVELENLHINPNNNNNSSSRNFEVRRNTTEKSHVQIIHNNNVLYNNPGTISSSSISFTDKNSASFISNPSSIQLPHLNPYFEKGDHQNRNKISKSSNHQSEFDINIRNGASPSQGDIENSKDESEQHPNSLCKNQFNDYLHENEEVIDIGEISKSSTEYYPLLKEKILLKVTHEKFDASKGLNCGLMYKVHLWTNLTETSLKLTDFFVETLINGKDRGAFVSSSFSNKLPTSWFRSALIKNKNNFSDKYINNKNSNNNNNNSNNNADHNENRNSLKKSEDTSSGQQWWENRNIKSTSHNDDHEKWINPNIHLDNIRYHDNINEAGGKDDVEDNLNINVDDIDVEDEDDELESIIKFGIGNWLNPSVIVNEMNLNDKINNKLECSTNKWTRNMANTDEQEAIAFWILNEFCDKDDSVEFRLFFRTGSKNGVVFRKSFIHRIKSVCELHLMESTGTLDYNMLPIYNMDCTVYFPSRDEVSTMQSNEGEFLQSIPSSSPLSSKISWSTGSRKHAEMQDNQIKDGRREELMEESKLNQPAPGILVELIRLNVRCDSGGYIQFTKRSPLCGKLEELQDNERTYHFEMTDNSSLRIHNNPMFNIKYQLVDYCYNMTLTKRNGSFYIKPLRDILECYFLIHLPYGYRIELNLITNSYSDDSNYVIYNRNTDEYEDNFKHNNFHKKANKSAKNFKFYENNDNQFINNNEAIYYDDINTKGDDDDEDDDDGDDINRDDNILTHVNLNLSVHSDGRSILSNANSTTFSNSNKLINDKSTSNIFNTNSYYNFLHNNNANSNNYYYNKLTSSGTSSSSSSNSDTSYTLNNNDIHRKKYSSKRFTQGECNGDGISFNVRDNNFYSWSRCIQNNKEKKRFSLISQSNTLEIEIFGKFSILSTLSKIENNEKPLTRFNSDINKIYSDLNSAIDNSNKNKIHNNEHNSNDEDEIHHSNNRYYNQNNKEELLLLKLPTLFFTYTAKPILEIVSDCAFGWIAVQQFCVSTIEVPMNWYQGEQYCVNQGGHLASIRSELEQKTIDQLLINSPGYQDHAAYWVGASDKNFEGDFRWTDGLPFQYTNWFPGWSQHGQYNKQPNDDGLSGQDCIELRRYFRTPPGVQTTKTPLSSNFMWNDRDCNAKNFVICERPMSEDSSQKNWMNDCNKTVSLTKEHPKESVWTPAFPRQYPDNANCYTTVTAPSGYRIILEFEELVIENEPGCSYDYLEITEPAITHLRTTDSSKSTTSPSSSSSRHTTYRKSSKRNFSNLNVSTTSTSSTAFNRNSNSNNMAQLKYQSLLNIFSNLYKHRSNYLIQTPDYPRGNPLYPTNKPYSSLAKRMCGDWSSKLKLLRYVSNGSYLGLHFVSDYSHHFGGFKAKVYMENTASECSDERLKPYNNSCYLFVSYPDVDWYTAQQVCRGIGAQLSSVLSSDEHRFITTSIRNQPDYSPQLIYWLGGELATNGAFEWSDGMNMTFQGWLPGQGQFDETPVDSFCLALQWKMSPTPMLPSGLYWDAQKCRRTGGYVCKKHQQSFDQFEFKNETIRGIEGRLVSHGYPNPYPLNIDYWVHIIAPERHRIIIQFQKIDLEAQDECLYDYVSVQNYETASKIFLEPGLNPIPMAMLTSDKLYEDFQSSQRYHNNRHRIRRSDRIDGVTKQIYNTSISNNNKNNNTGNEGIRENHFLYDNLEEKPHTDHNIPEPVDITHARNFQNHFNINGERKTAINYTKGSFFSLSTSPVEDRPSLSPSMLFSFGKSSYRTENPTTSKENGNNIQINQRKKRRKKLPNSAQNRIKKKSQFPKNSISETVTSEKISKSEKANSAPKGKSNRKAKPQVIMMKMNDITVAKMENIKGKLKETKNNNERNNKRAKRNSNTGHEVDDAQSFLPYVRWCGSHDSDMSKFDFISGANEAILNFHSDYSVSGLGFAATWKAIDMSGCPLQTLTSREGTVSSPNYPHFLLNNLDCTYIIQAPLGGKIWIEFLHYDIREEGFLYIDIGNGPFQPFKTRNHLNEGIFVSLHERIKLQITTGQRPRGKGFTATYKTVGPFIKDRVVKFSSNSTGYLYSLNYPQITPANIDFTQHFIAPPGENILLELYGVEFTQNGCPDYNILEVYDNYADNNGTRWQLCKYENNSGATVAESNIQNSYSVGLRTMATSTTIRSIVKRNLKLRKRGTATGLQQATLTKANGQDYRNYAEPQQAPIYITSYLNTLHIRQKTTTASHISLNATIRIQPDTSYKYKLIAGDDTVESCQPNPCQFKGKCITTTDHQKRCQCPGHYTGRFCALTMCDLEPCLFGKCELTANNFKCHCQPGYTGPTCEQKQKPCADNPCEGRGECFEKNGGFFCRCYAWWEGPRCEKKMLHIPQKALSERMLQEPFWLGLITVFVVLAVIGLVWCAKRHFPEKIEKLLAEEAERNRPAGAVHGHHHHTSLREQLQFTTSIPQTTVTTPGAPRSIFNRLGIRKPSILSLSSPNPPGGATARTFSLDDLLRPPPRRSPSPRKKRNNSTPTKKNAVEKKQILQQLVSPATTQAKPKISLGELIQMSENRLKVGNAMDTDNDMKETTFSETSASISMSAPAVRAITDPKLEKKVTFARLLSKVSAEMSSGSEMETGNGTQNSSALSLPTEIQYRANSVPQSPCTNDIRSPHSTSSNQGSDSLSSSEIALTDVGLRGSLSSGMGIGVGSYNNSTLNLNRRIRPNKVSSADSILAMFRSLAATPSMTPSGATTAPSTAITSPSGLSYGGGPGGGSGINSRPGSSSNLMLNIAPTSSSSMFISPSTTPTASSPQDDIPGDDESSTSSMHTPVSFSSGAPDSPVFYRPKTSSTNTIEVPVLDALSAHKTTSPSTNLLHPPTILLEIPSNGINKCLSPIRELPTPIPSPALTPIMPRPNRSNSPIIQDDPLSGSYSDDEDRSNLSSFSSTLLLQRAHGQRFLEYGRQQQQQAEEAEQKQLQQQMMTQNLPTNSNRDKETVDIEIVIDTPPTNTATTSLADVNKQSSMLGKPSTTQQLLPNITIDIEPPTPEEKTPRPKDLVIPTLTVQQASPTKDPFPMVIFPGSPPPQRASIGETSFMFPNKQQQKRLLKQFEKPTSLDLPFTPPTITITSNMSELESELESPTTNKLSGTTTLLAPGGGNSVGMSYLSPFAMCTRADRTISESNLSSSGYSSMASPGPSRCGSSNPLCPNEMDESGSGGSTMPGFSLHASILSRRQSSALASCKEHISNGKSVGGNGSNVDNLRRRSDSETLSDDAVLESNDEGIGTDHLEEKSEDIHEVVRIPLKDLECKDSIENECKSVIENFEVPSLTVAVAGGTTVNTHSTQMSQLQLPSIVIQTDGNNERGLSPVSSRSESPLSERAGMGRFSPQFYGRKDQQLPFTDSDGLYDFPSSDGKGVAAVVTHQRRSSKKRERKSSKMTAQTQSPTKTKDQHQQHNQQQPHYYQQHLDLPSSKDAGAVGGNYYKHFHGHHHYHPPHHHGSNITARKSPKRRPVVRLPVASSSSSSESLTSARELTLRPKKISSPNRDKNLRKQHIEESEKEDDTAEDVSSKIIPNTDTDDAPKPKKISRLRAIGNQIRFLRRLEQSIRKREKLISLSDSCSEDGNDDPEDSPRITSPLLQTGSESGSDVTKSTNRVPLCRQKRVPSITYSANLPTATVNESSWRSGPGRNSGYEDVNS